MFDAVIIGAEIGDVVIPDVAKTGVAIVATSNV